MAKLTKNQRTISSETMTSVMKYAPKDGFKLTDDILNKIYTVIEVDEFEINGNHTFSVTMESEDGDNITLSASALKRSRMITAKDIGEITMYGDNKNIMLRSNADSVWNGSSYLHKAIGMKLDEDFVLPEKFRLRYAILSEDQDSGEPLLNPFLFKDFRKVVKEYSKRDEYPTMDDFREELLKTEAEGRLPFLNKSLTNPEAFKWVKQEVSDFRSTLVLEEL